MTVSASTKTEFLTNKTKYPQCRTSIQHWQLRDLVCACPTNPDELYYVHHNTVQHFSTSTKKQTQIQQLDFSPVSFTVGHGFMAAGGQESQLLIRDLKHNRVCYNAPIGGSINNACHIASFPENSTDPYRILVSNNDFSIKVFSLPSMEHVTYINLNVAVNYCSTSSDGNTLASVGDNNYVMLFDVRSSYSQIAKLKEYSDGGFACSFNAENTQLCAASQDGTLVVWDLRSRKVLTKVKSKQKAHRGAIRSVKYSKTACVDLLVYSEHTSYIHALDTRNFKEYQSVRISLNDKNLSGVCFSANSKNVYVGTEDSIVSYDVDMISRRMFAQGDLL